MTTPRILDRAFGVLDLPPLAMLVFIKMARLGNASGQVYASQETLTRLCNCSVRTIRRVQAVLRKRGYITRIANPLGRTDRYLLEFRRWKVADGQRVLGNRSKRPHRTGHSVRQNQDKNQKLNQRPGQSDAGRSINTTLEEVLSGISQAIAKRENEGGGHD